jgi:hypothetical protein
VPHLNARLIRGAALVSALLLGAMPARAADPYANAPPYLKKVDGRARIHPLLTAGQMVPLTGGAAGEQFRVLGVPDGLGAYAEPGASPSEDRVVLLVNHEFARTEGDGIGPFPTGSRTSEFIFDIRKDGADPRLAVVSGRCPVEHLYYGDPPRLVWSVPRGLGSLCSAFLADARVGFDRPVLLHGEESLGDHCYDGKGGLAWADFDGATYSLRRMGRAAWENIVAAPFTGIRTVLFGLEDGPSDGDGLHSQLYLYVGDKEPLSEDPLARNGLLGGSLYVFVGDVASRNSEEAFGVKGGTVGGHWSGVDWDQDADSLNAQSVASGAFAFVRIEDGAADPVHPGVFYFVTTGKPGSSNPYGHLYRLDWDVKNPTGPARLTLLLLGNEGVVSPDNIDVNRHGEIAICEDPNYNLKQIGRKRDASLWIYQTDSGALTRIAEVDRKPARAHALHAHTGNSDVSSRGSPGGWEVSGVIDAEEFLGRGAWLLDVQAHSLRIAPIYATVEGGQLLQVVWSP